MRLFLELVLVTVMASMMGCAMPTESRDSGLRQRRIGVHLANLRPRDVPVVKRAIAEVLAPAGVNVIVLEVNYGFEFQSHPELRQRDPLSKEDARELVAFCRQRGIRLIPMLNCLGHQSWAKNTFPLLTKYPEFDETPDIPRDNPNIYCRSWCPQHPKVNEVVFSLMDELIDAFQADAFHVGMDEVFLIASQQCPRCRGGDPAKLFAKAVNDYHAHLVAKRKVEMLMWGDRLLDAKQMGYKEWEASGNGTAGAVDLIPKDIIICDWHYGKHKSYPSVEFFQDKGFRVWPSSWKPAEAALAMIDYAGRHSTGRMMGHLFTTWVSAGQFARAVLPGEDHSKLDANALQAAEAFRAGTKHLSQLPGTAPKAP